MAFGEDWRYDLERWLEPFLAGLSHPARRRMCPLYVAGLIGPGDRKSVQPMAARAGAGARVLAGELVALIEGMALASLG